MKRIFIYLSSMVSLTLLAQPTTHSVMPAIGTVYSFNTVTGAITHAAGGSGQFWNFNPIANSVTLTYSIIPLSATTASDQSTFPAANYFRLKSLGSMTVGIDFLHIQNDRLIELGERGSGGNYNMKPVPYTTYTFGMNVGSTHVSTYTTGVGTTTRTVKCDGTGTLTTPYGTFNNAIRLKTYNIGDADTLFSYYDSQPEMRLHLHYVRKGDNSIANKFVYNYNYAPSGINETINKELLFNVYPNPTNGIIKFKGQDLNTIKNITIYNSTLQKCMEIEMQGENLSLESLQNGLYFIEVKSSASSSLMKVIKN
ncbi:MAG: T9SS type A sorting domain-containing protein [Sphingobacteriaceae bacterium]|nr:T9SS type A sorting domain-containing protein [Sphingobacteriaceae bacterium]